MLLARSSECETTLDMSDDVGEVEVSGEEEKERRNANTSVSVWRMIWWYKNGAKFASSHTNRSNATGRAWPTSAIPTKF